MSAAQQFIEKINEDRGDGCPFYEWSTFLHLHCNKDAIGVVSDYLAKPTNKPLIVTGEVGMGKDHLIFRLTYLRKLKAIHLSAEYMSRLLRRMKATLDEVDASLIAQKYQLFRLDAFECLRKDPRPDAWKNFVIRLARTGCKMVITSRKIEPTHPADQAILTHIGPLTENDKLILAKFYFIHEFGYEPQTDEDLRLCSDVLAEERRSCRTIAGYIKKARMLRELRAENVEEDF